MSTLVRQPGVGSAELADAIAQLYAAFAAYDYRPSMPACAHCVSDADLSALGSGPLDKLPAALLGRYAFKAVSTWGEVHDFKFLFPRLAELLAADRLPAPADVLTTKLARTRWHEWPAPERQAVHAFLQAWWNHGLSVGPSTGTASVTTVHLPAVAAAEPDLTPYLTRWHEQLADTGPVRLAALAHLVELVCNSRFQPDSPATVAALFWEPSGPAAAQTSAWLTSNELAEELDRALYDLAATPEARQLVIAAARLRRYRNAVPG